MSKHTDQQYDSAIAQCRTVFLNKTRDYGTSWRIMRLPSITDQIFIKAQRIRTIDLKGAAKVNEGIEPEFIGILNYSVMALMQMKINDDSGKEIAFELAMKMYDEIIAETKSLMNAKNHDYGEAWREMSQESFIDLTLSKLLRIKQILSNDGNTLISEGVDANFHDIVNYAVFALIKLEEAKLVNKI